MAGNPFVGDGAAVSASHGGGPLDAASRLGGAWLDRDLSWLEFNRRVLHEALDERTPLLERVKFLAIFSSNLDEFFMKRVALLRPAPLDLTRGAQKRRELLHTVRGRILGLLEEQAACYGEVIRPRLAERGIRLVDWSQLTDEEREHASSTLRFGDLAGADAAEPRRCTSVSVHLEPLHLVGVPARRARIG